MSGAITFHPIIVTIVGTFLLARSQRNPITRGYHIIAVEIFAFDCEQFIVLLR